MRGIESVEDDEYPDKFNLDFFASVFYHELESWSSADIACCDSCVSDYKREWPGLAAKTTFQNSWFPLDLFREGSSLAKFYTESEFEDLCKKMGCPVCGGPLTDTIWVFDPHFDVPDGFTKHLIELVSLCKRTPFLVLRHPFARRVLGEIEAVAANAVPQSLASELFRARPMATARELNQFLAPPAAVCEEGRYNHAGCPVLYLASSATIAYAEIGKPNEGCLVADVRLKKPQKILDLASEELPSDLLQAATSSALLSAPAEKDGWEKPEYTFSRFVADCAVSVGFTGLKYPSVADAEGFNLVLFPSSESWPEIAAVGSINEFHP